MHSSSSNIISDPEPVIRRTRDVVAQTEGLIRGHLTEEIGDQAMAVQLDERGMDAIATESGRERAHRRSFRVLDDMLHEIADNGHLDAPANREAAQLTPESFRSAFQRRIDAGEIGRPLQARYQP